MQQRAAVLRQPGWVTRVSLSVFILAIGAGALRSRHVAYRGGSHGVGESDSAPGSPWDGCRSGNRYGSYPGAVRKSHSVSCSNPGGHLARSRGESSLCHSSHATGTSSGTGGQSGVYPSGDRPGGHDVAHCDEDPLEDLRLPMGRLSRFRRQDTGGGGPGTNAVVRFAGGSITSKSLNSAQL